MMIHIKKTIDDRLFMWRNKSKKKGGCDELHFPPLAKVMKTKKKKGNKNPTNGWCDETK
jgi:hypothetical protein